MRALTGHPRGVFAQSGNQWIVEELGRRAQAARTRSDPEPANLAP
jgi:hypothetical protein